MYTKQDIIKQLDSLGVPRDKIVMMHTSYRKVGDFEGGPTAFLDALIEYFTSEGGLFCIPTHTWGLLGKSSLTLDMTEKYTNLGLIPRLALERGDGVRSENPTHSVIVFGDRKKALEFIEGINFIYLLRAFWEDKYREKQKLWARSKDRNPRYCPKRLYL